MIDYASVRNGTCRVCGEALTSAGECSKYDHRPARLYPGYDCSGGPLTPPRSRCELAAERMYAIFTDVIPEMKWHMREEIVRRLAVALGELVP